jgi:ElaB/YqjD/DUF883 family membrane-anchored ribosome-binding protein
METSMNDNIQNAPQANVGDGLAASMQGLTSHAEALLQSTATLSSEGVAALRQGLSDSLNSVREQTMARSRQVAGATQTYVHEKPWQAIAIAALLGVAIGFLGRGARR